MKMPLDIAFSEEATGSRKRITIIFGRPGAGKTSIASVVCKMLESQSKGKKQSATTNECLYLDLDDCVPQWMKDNFSKGIYPNLQQRIEFAHESCRYVRQKTGVIAELPDCTVYHVLISFSFVNKDLREIFRSEFPNALWILVNTSEEEAQKRIESRNGHFYHGPVKRIDSKVHNNAALNNDDWKFYPVTFPHISLNGLDPIQDNSQKVVAALLSMR